MSNLLDLKQSLDPVISVVLEQILEVGGIDPEFLHPNDRLVEDLGMSSSDVQTILLGSARSLGLTEFGGSQVLVNWSSKKIVGYLRDRLDEAKLDRVA